ncbi:45147e93-e310-4ff8-8ff7-50a780076a48 [Sclerotinia trifoliorum]|uniref:45147e93-e310-4ff8-8ff7-50a780076a48 n=1 Tax=Sclerotinia trifoliorum TaxID=28548 RepID=A0A8H2VPZ9_9HELO|nr:45147e93-e310-4ff8-8ff7-50a780076a48 [Sclerotinia trifoliorum]
MTSSNSSFDPFMQSINILMADGITNVSITPVEIDFFYYYNVASCINYGAQAGACLLMFFVVVVLTKTAKRRSILFVLNILSLIFGFLRAMLFAVYFVQGFNEFYAAFTMDFSRVPRSAYASSVTGSVIPLCMTITVNMSLYLQAYTVCKGLDNIHRIILTGLSGIVALLAIGFRFATTVVNSMAILATASSSMPMQWLAKGTLVTETISIWFFSLVFTGKLVWTLYNRRRNGWRQWSAVRILAAMGGCTMVIPSIFAALEYITPVSFPEAGTLALTMVALLLPISALWASMATDEEMSSIDMSNLTGSGGTYNSQSGSYSGKTCTSEVTTQSSRLDFQSRKGSNAMEQVTTIDSVVDSQARYVPRDSTELDLEAMGVRIDRSYGVQKA